MALAIAIAESEIGATTAVTAVVGLIGSSTLLLAYTASILDRRDIVSDRLARVESSFIIKGQMPSDYLGHTN